MMPEIPSYAEYPIDEPIPRAVVELIVTETVSKAIAVNNALIVEPKHIENRANFKELMEGQSEMTNILNQIRGAIKVFVVLAFILGVVYSMQRLGILGHH